MQPESPVLPGYDQSEIVIAKDQPEYRPLPSLRNIDGVVLTRWSLTEGERAAVAAGADIYLSVHTFNHPLQPVMLEVAECALDLDGIAQRMGIQPAIAATVDVQ